MATSSNHFISAVVLLGLVFMSTLDFTVAQVGVCYGLNGDNLPSPSEVVDLYKQNNIQRMRIYDPNPDVLQALGGSNIELIVGVPNSDLQNIASDQGNADSWVQNNIRNYPDVNFKFIAVGNEVSPVTGTAQYVPYVLQAMQNIQNSISGAGLGGQIKVSTSVETGLLGNSYPSSAGVFRDDVMDYINPIVSFCANNGSPLLVNIYPYFARISNPQDISLDYALFRLSEPITQSDGVQYQNLFAAQLDAFYAAVEKAGGGNVGIVVSESGWPSDGGDDASVDNAGTYNRNLIQHVGDGTPKKPGQYIETYIFAMFDEDNKGPPETEKHFGLFTPNKDNKYGVSFN